MNRHAVQQAAAWYFSASQLSNAEDCMRIWAWEKICGIYEHAGPAAALGTETHSVLERWLGEGVPPSPHTRVGQIAIPGLKHLPYPGPELEIEREFRVRIGDFHYRGMVDVGFVDTAGVPWVVDHKTTGDFKWMKTPDILIDDIQALMYAKQALDRYQTDVVHLRWVYYHSRKPFKSAPVDLRLTRDQVDARWPVIDDLARSINQVRLTVVDPLTLPPNAQACSRFGGCPHIKRCNLTFKERTKSIMTQQTIRDRMESRVALRQQGQTPGAVPAVALPANQAPPAAPAPVAAAPQAAPPAVVAPVPVAAPLVAPAPVAVAQVAAPVYAPAPGVAAPAYAPPGMADVIATTPPGAVAPVQQPVAAAPVYAPAPVAAAPQLPPGVTYQPAPVPVQQSTPMNPPEQPPVPVQMSSVIAEEQVAPGARANEQEASATAAKAKKPRATKPKGFIIEDRRTALVLVQIASVIGGGPAELAIAHQAIAQWYSE